MASPMLSRFFGSRDGLNLHVIDFRPVRESDHLPVVCLPGLTRSAVDFTTLAGALASDADIPRRVIAFDYRGRGRSDHDPDWRHYDLAIERADVLKGLAEDGIARAHFIGTSRGGLHIMALAATHRAMIASAVFNDIGPVLEPAGLARIKGYVGKMVSPRDLDDAIAILRHGAAAQFDGLSDAEWRVFATTTFGDDETDLRLRYDPQLARTLDSFDLEHPIPDLWDLFDLLRGVPTLTLRGAHSDLLSEATLASMGARWTGCETMVVPGQAHAPLLADFATIDEIRDFLSRAE